MMGALELDAIAQAAAVRMVESLVEGGLILIFAGLVLTVRRLNSGAKFAVWFCALIAIAALPLLGRGLWSDGVSASVQATSRSVITLPVSWALYMVGAWAVLAFWFLVGVGRGLWHLRMLRKSCAPVDASLLDVRLRETLARNCWKRPVTLCLSDQVQVPTAIGFVKPVVLIPGWVMQELSAHELNQIVLHELAHLQRWDDWTNLAQKVVKAVFFFHPAVWWIEKRLSLEREIACDDVVLAETAEPRAYAECLAHLAEKTLVRCSVALAQAALGRLRQTSQRVAQILDVNRSAGTTRAWGSAVALVAAFSVASVLGVARAPRLVAFSDSLQSAGVSSTTSAMSESRERSVVSNVVPVPYTQASQAQSKTPIHRAKHKELPAPADRRRDDAVAHASVAGNRTSDSDSRRVTQRSVRQVSTDAVSVTPTQTVFVVVEGSEYGPAAGPLYMIRIWRVTVFRHADPVSKASPRKET
jgi:beta-lactamase regulating signal transducer with metallopeptidase domain